MKIKRPRETLEIIVAVLMIINLFFLVIGGRLFFKKEDEKVTAIKSFEEKLEAQTLYIQELNSGISIDNKRQQQIRETTLIIKKRNKLLKPEMVYFLSCLIVDHSNLYKEYDHILLSSLYAQESSFDPKAKNPISGATGIGQLLLGATLDGCMYFQISCLDIDEIREDTELNIKISSWYLHSRIVRYGNLDLGLAYYSGGEKDAVGYRYLKRYKNKNIKDTNITTLIKNIRPQTIHYVPKIRNLENKYRNLIKTNLKGRKP